MPPAEGLRLRLKASRASESLGWQNGTRGLTLRLEQLRELGAAPDFLQAWEHGWRLDAEPAEPVSGKNHPSMHRHARHAAPEYDRLHVLRKLSSSPEEKDQVI